MHTPFHPITSTQRNALLKQHPLTAYVVLAFAITWLLVLPLVLSAQGLLPSPLDGLGISLVPLVPS